MWQRKFDVITIELLTQSNVTKVRQIQRADTIEVFVDTADTIMELTQYELDHNCKGHTYAIKQGNEYRWKAVFFCTERISETN